MDAFQQTQVWVAKGDWVLGVGYWSHCNTSLNPLAHTGVEGKHDEFDSVGTAKLAINTWSGRDQQK